MKRWMKSILIFTLAIAVLLWTAPASLAAGNTPKDETVYALLESDGTVSGIYVVNAFELDSEGEITDYGTYSAVRNLTTTDELQVQGDQIKINAPTGWFYYEGKLESASLPWVISIQYFLDGAEVDADELPGTDGDLQIQIDIRANEDVGTDFSDHYMLQVSLSLDTEKCRDIAADGATITSAGDEKNIVFSVLPGNDGVFSVEMTVTDFEMEGLQISGVAMGMDVDMDTTELTDGLSELTDGIQELSDGADELQDGAGEYGNGIDTLADKTDELDEASANVTSGLVNIAAGFSELTGTSDDLSEGLAQLQDGLDQYALGLSQLQTQAAALGEGSAQFSDGLAQAVSGMSGIMTNADTLKAMAEGLQNSTDPQVAAFAQGYLALYDALADFSEGIGDLEEQYAAINAGVSQMNTAIGALSEGLEDLDSGLAAFAEGFAAQAAALAEISAGLNDLASNYSDMDSGISQLASSAAQLADAYADIYEGIGALQDGITELSDGTATLDSDVNDKINELMAGFSNEDFEPVSFVSSRNTNINSVQFIIKTDAISIEEGDPQEETETTMTLWERFIALFT